MRTDASQPLEPAAERDLEPVLEKVVGERRDLRRLLERRARAHRDAREAGAAQARRLLLIGEVEQAVRQQL